MIRRAFRIRHHIATASAFAWVSLMTSPAWASGSSKIGRATCGGSGIALV